MSNPKKVYPIISKTDAGSTSTQTSTQITAATSQDTLQQPPPPILPPRHGGIQKRYHRKSDERNEGAVANEKNVAAVADIQQETNKGTPNPRRHRRRHVGKSQKSSPTKQDVEEKFVTPGTATTTTTTTTATTQVVEAVAKKRPTTSSRYPRRKTQGQKIKNEGTADQKLPAGVQQKDLPPDKSADDALLLKTSPSVFSVARDLNPTPSLVSISKHRRRIRRAHGSDNILRVRGARNTLYKFRKVGTKHDVVDPLNVKTIQGSTDFKKWRRNAQLGLPSNIGVPVESTSDVLSMTVSTIEKGKGPRGSYSAKNTYNSLYDEMQKKYSERRDSAQSEENEEAEEADQTLTKKILALRELADHLSFKRQQKATLKRKGMQTDSAVQPKISCREMLERVVIKGHAFSRDLTRWCTIWKSDIHFIHGKFGLGAASYFRWLRTVVVLNLVQTFFVCCLLLFPEIGMDNSPIAIWNKTTTCPSDVLQIKGCSVVPHLTLKKSLDLLPLDLLTGVGTLKSCCYLYYSEYRDSLSDPYCRCHQMFPFPKSVMSVTAIRYTLMIFIIFLVNALYLAIQVKHYYHNSELESRIPGLKSETNVRALFSAWDFNVNDPDTAEILHKNIWRLCKATVTEKEVAQKSAIHASRPYFEDKMKKCFGDSGPYVVHFIITLIIILVYTGTGWAFWASFHQRQHVIAENLEHCSPDLEIPVYLLLLPSIVMSVVYLGTGHLCSFLAEFESWGSEFNRNFTMIFRVGISYSVSIGVTYGFFLYSASHKIEDDLCYEYDFGQELYRLVVAQGIFYFISSYLSYRIVIFIQRRRHVNYSGPRFDPVNYTMRLFYLHTVAGVGFFYLPLIGFLVLERLIVTFYHHKRMLVMFYRLPAHVVQSSELTAPFLISYFLSFMTTTSLNLYVLLNHRPSPSCGAFSHLNEPAVGKKNVYVRYSQIFSEAFDSSTNKIVSFLTSRGFACAFVIFLIAFVITLRTWGQCYLHTMALLYKLLQLERKDRDFLLEAIYHLVKRQSKSEGIDKLPKIVSHQEVPGSWADTHMMKNIFSSRRGTIAKAPKLQFGKGMHPVPLASESTQKANETIGKRKHGTLSSVLKDEFSWLPSQWTRRGRRSAKAPQITPSEVEDLQRAYREGLQSLKSDVTLIRPDSTIDGTSSTATTTTVPSTVKMVQETNKKPHPRKKKLL